MGLALKGLKREVPIVKLTVIGVFDYQKVKQKQGDILSNIFIFSLSHWDRGYLEFGRKT